jgi:glyoxylase-like metal-dependent hydrolase (beta-lactamase superfamily II)
MPGILEGTNMAESLFHFTHGEFKCIAIRDGGHMGSADFLFVNAPADELSAALRKHNLEMDQLPSSWTCLLVDTGDVKLLVDTGVGGGNPNGGQLLPQIEQSGYSAADIDLVFITHGHPDHLGGSAGEDNKPVFPRAKYLIGKREFEFWMEESGERMVQFIRPKLKAIEDHLETVEGESEVLPGIRVIEAYGHTPGHLGLEISSQGETLLNLADSVLNPLHLEHPEWYSRVDVHPEQMIATRLRLLELAAQQKSLVLFFHFEFPSLGYVEKDGTRWSWQFVR